MEIKNIERCLRLKTEDFWLNRGQRQTLNLFKLMAQRVPAYKDFLKKNKIDFKKIKTIADFKNIPAVDKQNYLRAYPLQSLCWDGNLTGRDWTIATTSGSTGEPFYFPRTSEQMKQYALVAELYLRSNFNIQKRSTLYIDAFPMGPWIGGVFTYETMRYIAEKRNYPLSIITTSVNKNEIIRAVEKLGKYFDQILIGCYAPFLKDALDEGKERGVKWSEYNLGFIFSAEGFTEQFRDYILDIAGSSNPFTATLNHYGTVDLGTMAHETPASILFRRLADRIPGGYSSLFGESFKAPTFCQYIPEIFYFEEENGELLCSGRSGLPLVRYDLKDCGGVISLTQIYQRLSTVGVNITQALNETHLKNTFWNLPFVYVFERNDFSVSLYAFQIYPQTVRRALLTKQLSDAITGKFTMQVKFNKQQNQYLEINIELRRNISPTPALKSLTQRLIVENLLVENSEYSKTYSEVPDRVTPNIVFWPYEDPVYFQAGIKQRWVKK